VGAKEASTTEIFALASAELKRAITLGLGGQGKLVTVAIQPKAEPLGPDVLGEKEALP